MIFGDCSRLDDFVIPPFFCLWSFHLARTAVLLLQLCFVTMGPCTVRITPFITGIARKPKIENILYRVLGILEYS